MKMLIIVAALGVSFMASKCEINNTGWTPADTVQMK